MKKSRIVSILLLICFLLSWSMEPLAWAEHKHVAAKCGPNYRKWYEPNSSETHIVYEYEGDQLCGCGAFVEEGITTSRTESHTFSKYSCTKCGYQKEHTHVAGACAPNSKVTYGQNNSETHYRYEYEGDYICGCGAYVEPGNTHTSIEAHSFSGDRCDKCQYKKEHYHYAGACAPNSYITYREKDSETHYKSEYEGDYICSCGAYVEDGKTYTYTETHIFDGDTCTKCYYQRERHTHVAGACAPNSSVTYGQKDGESHYRYEYEGDYICGCGAYVEDGNTYTYVEEHSFDGDYCVVCGYQKEHVHVASKCAPNSSVWYDSKDNDTHIKYVYEGDYLCGCGAYVCEGVTNSYTEKHDFSNGICNDCNYQKQHKHKAAKCANNARKWCEYASASEHYVYEYEGDYLCSCGAFVTKGATHTTSEKHSFSNDVCIDCNYQKEHVHVAVKCAPNAYTTCEFVNDQKHKLIKYEGDHLCACGAFVTTGEMTVLELSHSFKDNVCTECGFDKSNGVHVHAPNLDAQSETVTYENITSETHTAVVYSGDLICSCGEYIGKGEVTSRVESHEFSGDTCIYCMYLRPHKHVAVSATSAEYYEIYEQIDAKTHLVTINEGKTYCYCGMLMSAGGVIQEVRNHTVVDNICVKCGYQLSLGEKSQLLLEEVLFGDFSDQTTIEGTGINIIVGELPYLGAVADTRDFVGSIVNYKSVPDVIINAVGFIPVIGSLKYSDEIFDIAKHSDDVIDALDVSADGFRYLEKASDESEGFLSYWRFKRKYGRAGDGYEWHHIVERSQMKRSGFTSEMVNNTDNIVRIDKETHRKLTALYNSKVEGTNMLVRDWLKDMTFEQQYEYGLQMLEKVGCKVK